MTCSEPAHALTWFYRYADTPRTALLGSWCASAWSKMRMECRFPRLEGCVSQGATVQELIEHMREAITLCFEVQRSDDARFVGVETVEV